MKVSNPPVRSSRAKLVRKLRRVIEAVQGEKIAKPFAKTLGQALDLALENRLTHVVGHPGRRWKSKEEVLDICNLPLKNTELSYRARHHCEMRGVLFVGELLRLSWDRRSPVRTELEGWLMSHGIQHSFNVIGARWRPPYASDPGVLTAWDQPIEWLYFRNREIDFTKLDGWASKELAGYHRRGIHYLGHLGLQLTVSASGLRRLQDRFRSRLPIRPGMVSVGWTPKSEPIPAWEQHRAAVALKQELAARESGSSDPWPEVLPPLDAIERWLELSPDVLDLSVRSSNCMRALEIKTIRQLAMYREQDLLRHSNFGRKSLLELIHALSGLGLHLGMTLEEIQQVETTSKLKKKS